MTRLRRALLGAVLLGACAGASAHTGHGADGIAAGLAHPLGLDHLLAMAAVGVWSAVALPAGRRAAGPAVFMLALLVGAVAGAVMGASPLLEAGIALSVVGFGALLLAPRAWRPAGGMAWIAAAALLHGLAHGAEGPPGAAFAGYAAGFLATTALLHGAGLGIGHLLAGARQWVWRAAAAGLGSAGLLMLARL